MLDDATNNAMLRVTTVDCLDAALKFLVKYGFLVDTSKTRWVVRKPFTPDDVDEACEVARLCGAPRLDHESAFDTLRRVREGQQPQSQQ